MGGGDAGDDVLPPLRQAPAFQKWQTAGMVFLLLGWSNLDQEGSRVSGYWLFG